MICIMSRFMISKMMRLSWMLKNQPLSFNQLILSRDWSQLMMCELRKNSPDVNHHKILSLNPRTLRVKKTYKWLKDGGILENLVECSEESWLITLFFAATDASSS